MNRRGRIPSNAALGEQSDWRGNCRVREKWPLCSRPSEDSWGINLNCGKNPQVPGSIKNSHGLSASPGSIASLLHLTNNSLCVLKRSRHEKHEPNERAVIYQAINLWRTLSSTRFLLRFPAKNVFSREVACARIVPSHVNLMRLRNGLALISGHIFI